MKVVGRATEVRFDVGKGHFKMTVSVGWDDRIPSPPSTTKAGISLDPETNEVLATEVYIPLVHYAHPRLLEDAAKAMKGVGPSVAGGRGRPRSRTPRPTPDAEPLSMSVLTTATATTVAASSDSEPDTPRSLQSRSTAVGGQPAQRSFSTTPPSLVGTAPLLIRDCTPDLVDVEVKISGGRFVVRGQTLFWWYDVPSAEGEPRKEYTLEVKRRGGVLKRPRNGQRVVSEEGCCDGCCGGWCVGCCGGCCEQLCPEDGPSGCVVA